MRRIARSLSLLLALGLLLFPTQEACSQPGLDLENDTLTQSVLIHPPVDASGKSFFLSTREHTYRSQLRIADQLARDFSVTKVGEDGIARPYEPGTQGTENEDWYGWKRGVLAPFDGVVTKVVRPDTTNEPGTMNRDAQPGLIVFEDQEDGITVAYAHVREVGVKQGETVEAGETVAKVGNNGNSRAPHVHVGAWKGETELLGAEKGGPPLQVQVDLYAEQRSGDGK